MCPFLINKSELCKTALSSRMIDDKNCLSKACNKCPFFLINKWRCRLPKRLECVICNLLFFRILLVLGTAIGLVLSATCLIGENASLGLPCLGIIISAISFVAFLYIAWKMDE
jgi:hypothetical protein